MKYSAAATLHVLALGQQDPVPSSDNPCQCMLLGSRLFPGISLSPFKGPGRIIQDLLSDHASNPLCSPSMPSCAE